MKKPITLFLFLCFTLSSLAQEIGCGTSRAMNKYYKENPKEYAEFLKFNDYTKKRSANRLKTSAKGISGNIIIPVVFHIYGREQNGATVTDEKILNSLQMVNDDFHGLNPDFHTVDPLFKDRRSTTNITFKLATIDPNGNPTSGIVDHPVAGGQGNYDSPIVAADAWDNYKYMNVYITADIHDDGVTTNSGIAWYPNKTHSDAKRARVTYNGRYLKGNTDDEFASILTHEFGHWLNLLHTFEGGCSSINQDYVEDTPQEDVASADDFCLAGATDCGDSLINYENYMGYDSTGGCAKMFTKGQTDRMYAALNHEARFPLWQNTNLVATGTGGSLAVTTRMHDGSKWKENASWIEVCPGTNVKIGMQNVGINNVEILKPNGEIDTTPDASTYWNINNVQESDAGAYLIKYTDASGNFGFGTVRLYVGFKVRPWVQYDNTTTNWFNVNKLKACPGSNISIGMQANRPGTSTLRLPNGNLHTVAADNGVWKFNNITSQDAGVYTILYDMGGCTYSTQVELITENNITPWVALNGKWVQRSFVEACVGEKVHLGIKNIGLENVTITGPNNFSDSTPDVGTGFEFTSITDQNYGTYTITWNDPASCSGSVELEIRPRREALDGWVKDNANKWTKSRTLFACEGDNIALGTNTKYGIENMKITYPDGSVDTTPDSATAWDINNIQKSHEGVYKLEFNNGQCYSSTTITLKVGIEDLTNKIEHKINSANFTSTTNNQVTIKTGDEISLRLPSTSFNGTINWTGPNNFSNTLSTAKITENADSNLHAGIYTATVTNTIACSANAVQTINFEVKFDGIITNPDPIEAGTVSTTDDKTQITTTTGDGIADVIAFKNTSTSNTNYSYLITDEVGKILTTETSSHDFEGATIGICKVYGIAFVGTLQVINKNISDIGLATGDFDVSSNFITVTRIEGTPIDTEAPTAPTNLTASNITQTSLTLNWLASTDNVAVTEYDIYQGGTKIKSITTTTYNVINLTANTSYSFSIKAKDAKANESVASTILNITTKEDTSGGLTYCESAGTRVQYEWIAGVTIGTFSNTSVAATYTDLTSKTIPLNIGTATSTTLTPGYPGTPTNEYFKVWIDYNQNGTFDTDEVAFDSGTAKKNAQTGTITVPSNAKLGVTRMRVSMKYNGAPASSCGNIGDGSVQDFSVAITNDGNVVTAPVAEFIANSTSVDKGTSISFTDQSTNSPTSWSWSFTGGTPSTSSVQNPSITYNTPGVYQVTLTATNTAGSDSESKTGYITVKEPDTNPITYCASSGTRVTYEWIAGVQVGAFSKTSTAATYIDLTSNTIPLSIGVATSTTLTPGYPGNPTPEYFKVWIDYNQNGEFDTNEIAFDSGTAKNNAQTGTITVPSSAKLGETRMRVSMKYNGAPTSSCGNIGDGSVQDFTVNITNDGTGTDTQAPSAPSNVVASNITQTSLTLTWNASTDNVAVTEYEIYQDGNNVATTNTTSFEVTSLTAATAYTFSIKAKDAAGNEATSNTINITTEETSTPPNDGTVVYVDMADVTVNSSNSWAPFQIEKGDQRYFGPWFSSNAINLVNYNKEVICEGNTNNTSILSEGTIVGVSSTFKSQTNSFIVASSSYTNWNGKSGYIGFNFKISGNIHYGWLYATVSDNGKSITFKDYAYNSEAGKGLTTKRPTASKANKVKTPFSPITSYPNPFEENITINVSSIGDNDFTLSVYTILGKELIHKNYQENPKQIVLGDQIKASGTYFIRVQTSKKTETLVVIKK